MFRSELIKSGERNLHKFSNPIDFVNITPLQVGPNLPTIENWKAQQICMPKSYTDYVETIQKFSSRKEDIWVVTYPKCGTTWTQEMVWLIMNNLDFEKAKTIDITTRSIFLELNGVIPNLTLNCIDMLNQSNNPRVIKTHLPMSLLPFDIWEKKPKIIYVARDPKDVVVSFFHHFKNMHGYEGTLIDFSEAFLLSQISYCSFWNHVLEFWKIRHEDYVLFLTYEEMKNNLKDVVLKVCKFLNKTYSAEEINALVTHLSFDQMKNYATCNNQSLVQMSYNIIGKEYEEKTAFRFMRKGNVGSYKLELPEDLIERFNQITHENLHQHGCNLF